MIKCLTMQTYTVFKSWLNIFARKFTEFFNHRRKKKQKRN